MLASLSSYTATLVCSRWAAIHLAGTSILIPAVIIVFVGDGNSCSLLGEDRTRAVAACLLQCTTGSPVELRADNIELNI